jgi:hypothetical protein
MLAVRNASGETTMKAEKRDYEDDEYRRVRDALVAILSIDIEQAAALLHAGNMRTIRSLAELLRGASGVLANQWMGHILAKIPVDAWGLNTAGERYVLPGNYASMRFLSSEVAEKHQAIAKRILTARRDLMQGLERLDRPYHEVSAWTEPPDFNLPEMRQLPLNADVRFSETLVMLENVMTTDAAIRDQRWRDGKSWSIYDPLTPPEVTSENSRLALVELKHKIDRWCRDDGLRGPLPDSLPARVSVNLAANRAILELCAKDARAAEAAGVAIQFFTKLNEGGIDRVPLEAVSATLRNG